MKPRPQTGRKLADFAVKTIATGFAAAGIAALVWILEVVVRRGLPALNWKFFISMPVPPGIEGGGLANAITGTLFITALATIMALPPGILAGVYLAEFASKGIFASAVRFAVNILMSIPSIIVGLFVWGTIVIATGSFSGWAGGHPFFHFFA